MADTTKKGGLLAKLIAREKLGEFDDYVPVKVSAVETSAASDMAESLAAVAKETSAGAAETSDVANTATAGSGESAVSSLSSPTVPNDDTYLIFNINNERYALKSSNINQIVRAQKVRSLPFVPKYVEGILNVHGNPYTVVNTLILDGEENTEIPGLTFIVLKRDDDQFCIHVSNIELFFEPEDEDILEDRLKYKKQFINFFDADRIEAALLRDLTGETV